jgi:molybdopterin molybdotransferase
MGSIPTLPQLPKLNHPDEAIQRMCGLLQRLPTESIPQADARGRILAGNVITARPSPPLDVSAMDGFALASTSLRTGPIPICGVSQAGHAAPQLLDGSAVRIFTGAPVAAGADIVLKREDTDEHESYFQLKIDLDQVRLGQNIRRCGENAPAGTEVLPAGIVVGPAQTVALATFASPSIPVYRRVRTAILNTGDELIEGGTAPLPWQIHDSNGPLLEAMIAQRPWLQLTARKRVADQAELLRENLREQLKLNDALLLTGGVSMGDTDHVPHVLRELGATIVFHKLPIRPGKPILGAIGPAGQAIIGLPGNPVSVAATALRIAFPILKYIAGCEKFEPASIRVELINPDQKSIPLHWYRPVQFCPSGGADRVQVRLTSNLGSGDVVALSSSDAFIEIPQDEPTHNGPWNCFGFE